MFSRVSSIIAFIFILAGLAAATTTTITVTTFAPGPTPTTPASQCNTDSLYCCETAQQANTVGGLIPFLLNFLGISISPVTALLGVDCTSLVLGGNSCSAQPVCCQNNQFAGAVVIGCTPVNVNL